VLDAAGIALRKRRLTVAKTRALFVAMLMVVSSLAVALQAKKQDLENILWDVDQQWLCAGPYQKPYNDCVQFRSKYWVDQFFEVQSTGLLRNRSEMVAVQSAAHPAPGVGPYPADFKLLTVYENIAVATDHTDFKTADPSGTVAFTTDSHVVRVFVQQNGRWRPAAAALVPVIPPGPASAQQSGAVGTKNPDAQLERQLAEIDLKWMDAARNTKLVYLKNLFTDEWSEIVGWNPTVTLSKTVALDTLAKINYKPGEGVFPDQFKLMAVYGDVALATDRRTRKRIDASGRLVASPHRALLIFVKENGQWRSAGGALVPIRVAE
jgi:ketosteroid isomerase-like protein